ncbi:hypothetical protein [Pseudomonas sp. P9_31]|uniref:hypothetical protein n=1 Tax=Pseudomonas sp. P9_31 TaxID=3043448 RepID=UPI002A35F074|nr:hypothetical protein [Pseudomonas sp. P9_31]WPN59738.1 hypothetical protein QMK51_09090 [Pseudomonas sp. P9_31]
MKIDWIEWVGRGMQLALVVLVVGGLYQWSAEASRKREALCGVALSHVENLNTAALAAAAGVSVERYAEAEYAVAMSGSAAKADKWIALWSEWYDRIPADARREVRNAQSAADDACAEPEYNDY